MVNLKSLKRTYNQIYYLFYARAINLYSQYGTSSIPTVAFREYSFKSVKMKLNLKKINGIMNVYLCKELQVFERGFE